MGRYIVASKSGHFISIVAITRKTASCGKPSRTQGVIRLVGSITIARSIILRKPTAFLSARTARPLIAKDSLEFHGVNGRYRFTEDAPQSR